MDKTTSRVLCYICAKVVSKSNFSRHMKKHRYCSTCERFVHVRNHFHVQDTKPNFKKNVEPYSIILPYSQVISKTPSPLPQVDWVKCLTEMDILIEKLEAQEIYDEMNSFLDFKNNSPTLLEIESSFELALVILKKDEESYRRRMNRIHNLVSDKCKDGGRGDENII